MINPQHPAAAASAAHPPPERFSLASLLVTVEDAFVPRPLTERSVAVRYASIDFCADSISSLSDLVARIDALTKHHGLVLNGLGWGDLCLVADFASRRDATLFKLLWIDQ